MYMLETEFSKPIKKKRVLAIPADLFACGNYRIIEPYQELSRQVFPDIKFEVFDYVSRPNMTEKDFIDLLLSFDAVVFQRTFRKEILAFMATIKKYGIKVLMDIDDDLFNISQQSPAWSVWHPGSEPLAVFTKALEVCDVITVSTPELTETYKGRAKNFEVFLNGINIDHKKYTEVNSLRNKYPMDKTLVMWSGSSTHFDSFEVIKRELKPVFDSHPDARFVVCSNIEYLQMVDIPDEQKIWVEPVVMEEFYNIPSVADIAISPVKINKFNEAKSELKCLESYIWGVPVVSSPAAPYIRFNKESDGANLIVKNNRGRDWVKNINTLIDDPNLRRKLGQQGKRTVLNKYSLHKINEKRYEFFQKLLKTK